MMVTRQLVDLMEGSIDFESSVGEGSLFWVDFARMLSSDEEATSSETGMSPSETVSSEQSGVRVLYIEDNIANVKFMERVFSRQPQYQLTSSLSAFEGLETAMSHSPDIILLDINMPDMDGYQVLEQLKASHKTADIPVIAVTANAMAENISKGLEAGFDDYLTKPIDINKLRASLEEALRD